MHALGCFSLLENSAGACNEGTAVMRKRSRAFTNWGCDSRWTKNNVSASETGIVVLDFQSTE